MQCSNNAKQIGLALHNYHDVHKKFPKIIWGNPDLPANENGGVLPRAYHHTWLTGLLPYMEQQAVYDRIDFRLRAWGQPHIGTLLPALRCPTDGGFTNVTETHGIAWTNYAGSEGYHWWPTAQFGPWSPWLERGWVRNGDVSGVFAPGKKWRSLASIKDGTSNTVICAETDAWNYYGGPQLTTGTGIFRPNEGWAVMRSRVCRHGLRWLGNCRRWHDPVLGCGRLGAEASQRQLVPAQSSHVSSHLFDRVGYEYGMAGRQQRAHRWYRDDDQG